MEFDEFIREGRKLLSLTTRELSVEIGISPSGIVRYEKGERIPHPCIENDIRNAMEKMLETRLEEFDSFFRRL